MPRIQLQLILFAILGSGASASEPQLRLVAEFDGRRMPLTSVEDGKLYVRDGDDFTAAPDKAVWAIEGDIRAHADFIRWSPSYDIVRNPNESPDSSRPWIGYAFIQHVPPPQIDRDTIKDRAVRVQFDNWELDPSPFLEDWPEGESLHGALVFVWLTAGRAVEVKVKSEPSTANGRGFRCRVDFALTDEQARGQPLVLYWAEGSFIAPVPLFDHAPTQEALIDILLDDPDRLPTSVRRARLRAFSRDGATLAHYAAEAGAANALERLLDRRSRLAITSKRESPMLPVHWAVAKGRNNTMTTLIHTIDDVEAPIGLLNLAINGGHAPILRQLLLEAGLPLDEPDDSAFPHLLLRAINAGHPEVAEQLIAFAGEQNPAVESIHEALADGGLGDSTIESSLSAALVQQARLGRTEIVAWLIQNAGIDPNVEVDESTALIEAVNAENGRLVRRLLRLGASPKKSSSEGTTPLMQAAARNRPDFIDQLLAAGADVHATDIRGFTALHFAALRNAAPIVAQLLEAGADLTICDVSDMTALDTALLNDATEAIDQLVERGACIALGSRYSSSLLEAAIRLDAADTVARAIEDGWPPNSTFAGIWPAIRVAQIFGANACEEVLRAAGAHAEADKPMPVVTPDLLDAPLELRHEVVPEDPRRLFEAVETAAVELKCVIDRNGRVLFPTLAHTPDSRLGPAAANALMRHRFTPPQRDGQPVAVLATRSIVFPRTVDRIFDYSEVDRPPIRVRGPRPVASKRLVRKSEAARVEFEYIVGLNGRVEDVRIIDSTSPEYSESVSLAVSLWEFQPGFHRGTAVRVRAKQAVNYTAP